MNVTLLPINVFLSINVSTFTVNCLHTIIFMYIVVNLCFCFTSIVFFRCIKCSRGQVTSEAQSHYYFIKIRSNISGTDSRILQCIFLQNNAMLNTHHCSWIRNVWCIFEILGNCNLKVFNKLYLYSFLNIEISVAQYLTNQLLQGQQK